MKKGIQATLTKDYDVFKKGKTLSFSEAQYKRLKKEGYFRKVKKVTEKKEKEE